MDLDLFRENFIEEIEFTAIDEVLHQEKVFINLTSDILKNDYSRINKDLNYDCYINNTLGNRKYKSMKLDAASLDLVTNTLNLLICDYNNGECTSITNENINVAASKMKSFVENVIKGYYSTNDVEASQPIVELAREFRLNIKSVNKVQMFLVSTNKLSAKVKGYQQSPIECDGYKFDVDYIVLDIEQIYQTKSADFEKEDIVINVDDYGVDIPCLKADINATDYESYLAIVPGKFLAEIYNKFQSRLLEDNVRSFLNVKGAVNKGIRGTIINEKERFFTYNNGISTTAKEVEIEDVPGKGLLIKKLAGFQIINGGQTTASLAHALIKGDVDNLDGIYVQMKLTKTNNPDPEFVRLIAKYANSQNKVTNADLNSNHPFYQVIEDYSHGASKMYAPLAKGATQRTLWFFERVRGQYDQAKMKMTRSAIKNYESLNPKNQKFKKTDLAKYINSFNMLPHYVSCGADVNATKFQPIIEKEWEKDKNQFNANYYRDLIAKAIIFKHLEKFVSASDWYTGAYRANLVTYIIAKFMKCLSESKKYMNYKIIWDKQEVPEEFDIDFDRIGKLVYDAIYDSKRPVDNIGEYCKKEICWKKIESIKYSLSDETLGLMLDKIELDAEQVVARKDQKITNEVSLELEIFKRGLVFWHDIKVRGVQQHVLTEKEASMLELAENYCEYDKVRMLSTKQAKEIERIRKSLEENGIK